MSIDPATVAVICPGTTGNTKRAVDRLVELCGVPLQRFHVCDNAALARYDKLIIFSPTFGDEELHPEIELFLTALALPPRAFTVCELGNYYGYEVFEFGAAKIIRADLRARGWTEFHPGFSLDALPIAHWGLFEPWAVGLVEALG